MSQEEIHSISVAHISSATTSLGPGLRSALWVQGCPLGCKGCIAPEWQKFDGGTQMSIQKIKEILLSNPRITGITFSGGEPMFAAASLAELARSIRKDVNLSIICFTGFRMEEIIEHPIEGSLDLINSIDVLIDGRYIEKMNTGFGLRGSTNQRVHYLTNRLKGAGLENWKRKLELEVGDGYVRAIGIPPLGFDKALNNVLSV